MKYCPKCGCRLPDDAQFCIKCGQAVPQLFTNTVVTPPPATNPINTVDMKSIAKVFLVIGCVLNGFYLLSLCWTIPMTVHYFNSVKQNKPVGTGFKVCCLLFVSLVAGILMLCEDEL
ncbi:MAG: zinc-ribbon domain-containing protein [Clostridiales bacterium]|nr:zinc-ribbon domain-containing protein [Clostridiales bacterium]